MVQGNENEPAVTAEPPMPKLLVVDDEARQMTALCNTLRDQGYETTGFSAGQAALEALRSTKFDLVLTDLMMPEMDGITFLRAALALDPTLVGVVMTGHGSVETAVEAMKSGALDYILKPFKLSAVIPVLSRAMTVRRLRLENAVLEQRVRERTKQLETANSALEDANKELEAFSYSVSHDLRTPLRHVDGFAQMLASRYEDQLPEAAQRLLAKVCTGAQRSQQLIDDLLNFSRLGRQPLQKRQVSLSRLVEEVLREHQGEREGRQVDVAVDALPDIQGDHALLKQVFVNLISNALKFTRKREHAVIRVAVEDAGEQWHFFVQDNGAGFDMQYAEKLFGVFQRLHHEDQFPGTGVGLSIVQRIIHRHGGRIWAEAEVDKGATFHFTLPKASGLE
ncbi:response regulator receiver sensor signal transduction histidine kinase [Chthoniobacter flavus Ellin428]|uniref:histidine kinase n=1 Tax=Chthoniobacter flavus Ellin428 TaxID=497964 RepID=B4DC57_9BACT|nr:response regulator receiver sensor signal transduction histidine kinase [Chthoniobacter flavus Ellin428]TCO83293.1 phospho-acceptor domain-containing protein [Chthoniobacter flavus]